METSCWHSYLASFVLSEVGKNNPDLLSPQPQLNAITKEISSSDLWCESNYASHEVAS